MDIESHPGVKCDACDTMPICGFRFKCSTRENYDECENCVKDVERSHFGSQPKHDYLVIRSNYQELLLTELRLN